MPSGFSPVPAPPASNHRITAVTPTPNSWMDRARQIVSLGVSDERTSDNLLVSAFRVLLWLCSEQAPCPHAVTTGTRQSLAFSWQQGATSVRIEVRPSGRISWTATAPDLPPLAGSRLDDDAARIIRSLIPLSRTPVIRPAAVPTEVPGASNSSRAEEPAHPPRRRLRGRYQKGR